MLKRIVLGLVALAGSLVILQTPEQEVSAADVCVSAGVMSLNPGLMWPVIGFPSSGQMQYVGATGVPCQVEFYGTYQGDCLAWAGSGLITVGGTQIPFSLTAFGSRVFLTGPNADLIGTGEYRPLPQGAGDTPCFTSPARFMTLALVVAANNTPTTIPTVPTIPPLPGGPMDESDACVGPLVFDGGAQGVRLRAIYDQPAPDLTRVCLRAESSGQGLGGRLEIEADGPGLPSVPVPTTDSDGDACWTTAGNTVPGTHPAVKVDVPAHVYIDVYRGGGQVWLCAEVGTTGLRVLITEPSGGGGGIPAVRWIPDTGTPG